MPRLSGAYGITPRDLERMSIREIDEYIEQLPDQERRQAQYIAEVFGGG